MKKLSIGALLLALGLCALPLAGCTSLGNEPEGAELSFLKVDGKLVKNAEGEEVLLRGVNVGGLGVIEGWMTGFETERRAPDDGTPGGDIRVRDHYTISQVWFQRFGYEETKDLWNAYQSYWWTEQDFKNCKDMGINVIRLPFTYMNVDFEATVDLSYAGNYDFTFLDEFVNTAAKYDLYTILDLHGAYGSQNGQDHSGQTFDSAMQVDFYSNEQKLSLTANLWGAIAEHFKDNGSVAGYDLINEPFEKGGSETTTRHWDAMDRFYKAIRKTGDEHIVIFESCWSGAGLPQPDKYGWENCMYEFHHYTSSLPEESRPADMLNRITEVNGRDFGVPIFMGEFCCYEDEAFWDYTLGLLNDNGWHWTTWTYKILGGSSWGVYNLSSREVESVNAHTDSYDEILRKFAAVKTTNARKHAFESENTLYNIIQKYAKQTKTEGKSEQ